VPVQSCLQAGQVVLHVHNDHISLADLQPRESGIPLLTRFADICAIRNKGPEHVPETVSRVSAKLIHEVNRSEREVHHLRLSSAKDNNMCSFPSTPHASLRRGF
jgi:hypothetical protein